MRKFRLQTEVLDKVVYTKVSGDVDAGNANALRAGLEEAGAHALAAVVVDLSGVRRMDSAGIAVLIEVQQMLRRGGRRLMLAEVPAQILAMLEAFGVTVELSQQPQHAGDKGDARTRVRGLRLHDPTQRVATELDDRAGPARQATG
jgi:anti-anti-sigma factor